MTRTTCTRSSRASAATSSGKNSAGNLDPSDIGVANKKFLANAANIDRWNKVGLIRSQRRPTVSPRTCSSRGGRRSTSPARGSSTTSRSRASGSPCPAFPNNKCKTAPFTGVGGLAVTSFAAPHGVESLAKDFVASYMMQAGPQFAHYSVGGRLPANVGGGCADHRSVPEGVREGGAAGNPMPNIPQMASVWSDLGQAWVRSTKGSGALPARRSFIGAQKSIALKIG